MSSFFDKPKSTDWFNPKEHSDNTLAEKQDEILKSMAYKGITWASELSRDMGISADEINKILYNLKKLGFIDKIFPDPNFPSAPFRGRMGEFWARGIIGYQSFTLYAWWILTVPGLEYLKAKYKTGIRVKAGLVNHYGLVVMPLEDEYIKEDYDKIFDAIMSESKDLNTTLPSK